MIRKEILINDFQENKARVELLMERRGKLLEELAVLDKDLIKREGIANYLSNVIKELENEEKQEVAKKKAEADAIAAAKVAHKEAATKREAFPMNVKPGTPCDSVHKQADKQAEAIKNTNQPPKTED